MLTGSGSRAHVFYLLAFMKHLTTRTGSEEWQAVCS
jgi:hypothetical protein